LPIDEQRLQEWKGPHGFFWRIKIQAIGTLIDRYGAEPVMYVDSDTFLTGDYRGLLREVEDGRAVMHEDEGPLSAMRQKTTSRMWNQIRGRTYAGIGIAESARTWNAGVVAVPARENARAIRMALEICDEMCAAGVIPRLVEQFALSLA